MYRKILVTSDGSAVCEEAFPHVAQLAAEDAEVVLLTVTDSLERLLAQTSLADELAGAAGEIERVAFSMRIDTPEDGSRREGPTALIEVAGWAGAYSIEQSGLLDIAVIIDTSWSARRGSGADVNEDGHVTPDDARQLLAMARQG